MRPWPARRRLAPVFLLCAACLAPAALFAQATPRELREEAGRAMAMGDYMAAIPPLQELIALLGESKTPDVVNSMDMVYYNLALCQFFAGQHDQALSDFDTYLSKYKRGMKRKDALIYRADSLRYKERLKEAIQAYEGVMREYNLDYDMLTDIYGSIARCHLADGNWTAAMEPLKIVYLKAPDFLRRNWAATLLTTAFLKERNLDRIYAMVPFLLQRDSLASRSVAFNLAALEAADDLFAEEYYRDALWIYRLVYPYDTVAVYGEAYLERLKTQADRLRELPTDPRALMRLQENIGELEAELAALNEIDNYDEGLSYRIAMGYMEMMRYREGRELFLHLHRTGGDDVAEEALFLAFRCSSFIRPWDRAFEIGNMYMEKYPAGEFFDLLTLAMGQMYARLQDWPAVIAHLTRTLEISPAHTAAAECMFLLGYASFMEEKFADAINWLTRVNTEFPGNAVEEEVTYWLGMARLFDGDYENASVQFDNVVKRFPDCPYVADARFRRAVCDYGLSLYDESDERLTAFIASYPTNQLVGEAVMMRGDIAGAQGRGDEAVELYRRAMTHEGLNIEFYNHCAFQAGRILADDEAYPKLATHFREYIERNVEGSNIPLAIYWIGIALWNTGEEDGALRYYRQAVERFGTERAATSIDIILDEWIGRIKRSPKERAQQAWQEMYRSMEQAVSDNKPTLALRFKRVVLFDPNLTPSVRQRILQDFASEKTADAASAAVLQTMLDMAVKDGRDDFARNLADRIIADFTETDYALDARMTLARHEMAMARKAENAAAAAGHYREAVKHLDVIREVFAASSEAGTALLLLGEIHRGARKFDLADECYKSVLGVKGWRNMWPEALYGRGECAFDQRQYEQASAYYERIYVLYGHHKDWVAKAYLRRAECLKRLYQLGKAREVLAEMLANADLASLPETAEARKMMQEMGDQI